MTRGLKLFGALSIAAIAVAGCKSDDGGDMATETASMGAINDVCPVMGEPVNASAGVSQYNGVNVGFCCPGCKGAWEGKPASEKQAFVSKYNN